MPSNKERRKGLRAQLVVEMFFNLLDSPDEYMRGQATVIRKLAVIDAEKLPQARTEAQILLSRIDRKLSLILSILAENHNRKSYLSQATVQDISEFGLAFAHHTELPIGSTLEIGLSLPSGEGRILDMAGQIVRSIPGQSPETHDFTYGVEFTDILSNDQNEIVQWIFSRQREEIRRRREVT